MVFVGSFEHGADVNRVSAVDGETALPCRRPSVGCRDGGTAGWVTAAEVGHRGQMAARLTRSLSSTTAIARWPIGCEHTVRRMIFPRSTDLPRVFVAVNGRRRKRFECSGRACRRNSAREHYGRPFRQVAERGDSQANRDDAGVWLRREQRRQRDRCNAAALRRDGGLAGSRAHLARAWRLCDGPRQGIPRAAPDLGRGRIVFVEAGGAGITPRCADC